MKRFRLSISAIVTGLAVALLTSCGGSQMSIGVPGAMPQAPARTTLHHIAGALTYEVLHYFGSGYDGAAPEGSLLNVNGTLYGTTAFGGSYSVGCNYTANGFGCGTVYSITTGGTEKVLHSFSGQPHGAIPAAGLIDVNGTLYGTTQYGGAYNHGTVFRITTAGKEHIVYSFGASSSDGAYPQADLIDVNGTLYGTTYAGGTAGYGTVFSVTTAGTERVLHSFKGQPHGANPLASLINVKGTLYGTTISGGTYNEGTVFSITTAGKEHIVYSFGASSSDGAYPQADLIDVNGTLYGTTEVGGTYNKGTVFSVTTVGTEKVLHSFRGQPHGAYPKAGLINVNGTLYGTTAYGGTYNWGTVFSITTAGKEQLLYSFSEVRARPQVSLTDVNGTLYGTTFGPYSFNFQGGTVFALTP